MSKHMKRMIQERKRIIPNEENLVWAEDQVRKWKGWVWGVFGGREERNYRERSKELSLKLQGAYL